MVNGLKDILPQHIAIIMDGNGRWAQRQGLLRAEGHRAGLKAVKTVIGCCLKAQIQILSLFAFSSENWSRPAKEVEFLMQLFIKALNHEVQELHQREIQLRFTGDRMALSTVLQEEMQAAERLTAHNQRLILNVVVNYGGRWDIVQATKNIAQQVCKGELAVDEINEAVVAKALSIPDLPYPDLFIRTSGEQRISNFFLWQLAYTELYFTDTYWPNFTDEEFKKALMSFSKRERRYGKVASKMGRTDHV